MIRQVRPLVSQIGPEHAGLPFSADDFERLPGREGFRYELVDGVLHVSPSANPAHAEIQRIVAERIGATRNAEGRPVFANVLLTARVIVRDDALSTTNPEPDIAAYAIFPSRPPRSFVGLHPALVVEVVSLGSHDKDYGRNPGLYERVHDIREYWVIDPTSDADRPIMTVFHRASGECEFQRLDIPAGGHYRSRNWPAVELDLGALWR